MAASSYNKGKATTKSWLFIRYMVKDSVFVKRRRANCYIVAVIFCHYSFLSHFFILSLQKKKEWRQICFLLPKHI